MTGLAELSRQVEADGGDSSAWVAASRSSQADDISPRGLEVLRVLNEVFNALSREGSNSIRVDGLP